MRSGQHDQLPDQGRVLDRAAQAGAAAEGVAKQVSRAEPEVPDHAGYVVTELLPAERPGYVARVAMSLQLDGNDLAVLRELAGEACVHGSQSVTAMRHDQRGTASAPALPVDVDAVDGRVTAGDRRIHGRSSSDRRGLTRLDGALRRKHHRGRARIQAKSPRRAQSPGSYGSCCRRASRPNTSGPIRSPCSAETAG